jgi:hypothetical protein
MARKLFQKRAVTPLRTNLQSWIASLLFPKGKGDWYELKGYVGESGKTAFDNFVEQQKLPDGKYHEEFKSLDLSLKYVHTPLTNGTTCLVEVMNCQPKIDNHEDENKPGNKKHIVYFAGANTYYQACFRDITTAATETGATVHAFNFPGIGSSTGQVTEVNDLVNTGIAVVNNLLRQGVHPDDIILQGDCYGAGVALEVKKQFEKQSDIKLRLVMNNAFKSFKSALVDMMSQTIWVPSFLKNMLKSILVFTGWHLTPGKQFQQSGPYQCYVQHHGDQTLLNAKLALKVDKYRNEMTTGQTASPNREAVKDLCPEDYKADRDTLDKLSYVQVKAESVERLRKKFGADKQGNVNAHFADLCECAMPGTQDSAYKGFVNKYLAASNAYIDNHPQTYHFEEEHLPSYLGKAPYVPLSNEDTKQLDQFLIDIKQSYGRHYRPRI